MIRPDLRTYHEDWGEHLNRGNWKRDHFLGRSPRQFYGKTPVNVKKNGVLFEMELAMPGFAKDEIEIAVKDNILTVTAQKTNQEISKNKYIVQEFDVDTAERKFQLANIASHDKINAEYKNGILKLVFENCCDVNDDFNKRIPVN